MTAQDDLRVGARLAARRLSEHLADGGRRMTASPRMVVIVENAGEVLRDPDACSDAEHIILLGHRYGVLVELRDPGGQEAAIATLPKLTRRVYLDQQTQQSLHT